MSSYYMFLATGLVVLCLSTNSFAATGQAAFDKGVKAFKSKDFNKAIQAFETAKNDGLKSSILNYNLGVSYYKTGQYQKAAGSLLEAMHDTKLRQLSQYNLGLVYLKLKRKGEAINMFHRAAKTNSDPKVTALANKMLNKHATGKRKQYLSGLLSIAYGNDDNVNQTSTNSPTNLSDNYITTFAYIDVPFQSITLNASIFSRDYQDLDTEDLRQISAAILVPIKIADWLITPSLHLSKSELNSIDYQSTTDFKLVAKTSLDKKSKLAFRFRYTDIDPDGTAYEYLRGNRQQYRVEYKSKTSIGKIRIRYELETNDRLDLAATNYSPTRHTIRALLKRHLFGNTKLDIELGYRDSKYDPAARVIRRDKRKRFRFNLYNKISSGWTAGLRYVYTDNDSNLSAEKYTRGDSRVYVNWRF